MIIDFPEIKSALDEQLRRFSRRVLVESAPLIRLIPKVLQHEGETHQYNTLDGAEKQMSYDEQVGEFSFSTDELPSLSKGEIFRRCGDAMRQMAGNIERDTFQTLGREVEEVGNTLKSTDPCSPENFLAALDKVLVDFDGSRERPAMPTLFANQQTIKEFQRRFEALTPDQRYDLDRRRDEILDRKYAEYLSREGDRKLVD